MTSARPAASLLATALLAAGFIVVSALPAAAHTRAGAASDYESRILHKPAVDGLAWGTYAGGDLLEVAVEGDIEVIITGYEGEPYLRVGPEGVHTNRNSPATYLNTERYGDVAIPPRADAGAPPDWKQVSASPSHAWHDHRIHWMGTAPPPAVRAAPDRTQLVQPWVVAVIVDGTAHELTGELWWVPGGSAWPWLAGALLLTAPAALGVARARRSEAALGPVPRIDVVRTFVQPAAVVVAAVAGFNTLHFIDELMAWPAPTLDIAFGVLHTVLFVGIGLVGAAVAWRGSQGPFLSLGIASGAVLFHQGLLQWQLMVSSQLPTVLPGPALRLAVALSIAQAAWVGTTLAIGMRAAADPAGKPSRTGSGGRVDQLSHA